MSQGPPGANQIEVLWYTLTQEHEHLHDRLRSETLRRIDEACKRQINAGEYDATVDLATVFEWFRDEHLRGESEFVTEVLESDAVFLDTLEFEREQLGQLVFERLVEELEADDELLYVYDRQRVRSRVAEMARYFALVRQRLNTDEWTDFGFAPNVVKMVKLDILDREQPIVDPERASRFGPTLRRINRSVSGDEVLPANELAETVGDEWRDVVSETVEVMGRFFEDGLPESFGALADYQADAFVELYVDSVTESLGPDHEAQDAYVITASTGGGKTEAFLFPSLAYCHTAWQAGIAGNKAVLTYPRQDLCNNQFERLLEYAFALNAQLGCEHADFEDVPISIGLQHGAREDVEPDCPFCDDDTHMENTGFHEGEYFVCTEHPRDHRLEWATTDRQKPADVIVTTQNSLHVRLMDKYGKGAFWSSSHPTKFLVLDEVHVYTEQSGMHVANVVRRFKRALEHRNDRQTPSLVASSATIHEAEDFTGRIFDVDEVKLVEPGEDETETTGSEYMIFVKATDPRDVEIPIGDSVFKPRDEWGSDLERTTASNLSCMIQIAFAFHHTVRKEAEGDRPDLDVNKDRILGFVDSIDSVGRLGSDIEDAEWNRRLFELRRPDAFLRGDGTNPDCPSERFRQGIDGELDEHAVCENVVPNPHLNECSVYEAGECWWTMRDRRLDLRPIRMAIHKSGNRQYPPGSDRGGRPGNDWDQLIATSALEVGFDHPSIIGTFQYRAPMSVPGFIQRKGRGGRDSDDKPVTVSVLGSTSTDSFYFHHSEYLSRPRDEHLEIPLDERNQFIRAEHMTAAVFDYFNVRDGAQSERIYRGSGSGEVGPDIEYLSDQLDRRSDDIRTWLSSAFEEDEDATRRIIDELEAYIETLEEPLVPGKDDTPYWRAFREIVSDAGTSGNSNRVDDLAGNLRRASR